jgi:serine/threonine protein kinase
MAESGQRFPEGTMLAEKLRVVGVLGAGGMGVVYEVEHTLTRHRRALKVLHAEMLSRPPVVARFLREASAAGHIGNPHIVETFDAGRLAGGEPYIVMELLHGQSLAAKQEREKRLGLADLVETVGQACDGVQAAHDAGIVHRDLKPENLFLLDTAGAPFVKILDFGVSKFAGALSEGNLVTREGVALGTPYYMSPEQVAGAATIDGRSDIYALGVILYECASGVRPFEADAFSLLCALIHEGKPRSLAELRPDLPPAFVDVVHRAMAHDRDRRFASARELGAALGAFGSISHLGVKAGFSSVPPPAASALAGPSAPPGGPTLPVRSAPPVGRVRTGDGSTVSVIGGRRSRAGTLAIVVAAGVAIVAGLVSVRARSGDVATIAPLASRVSPGPPVPSVDAEAAPLRESPSVILSPEPSSSPVLAASASSASRRAPPPVNSALPAPPPPKSNVDRSGLARDNPYGQ